MFGRKAKKTAADWKASEPKVDDVKVDDVDTGESFREKTGKVDVSEVDDGAKSFGQAFKDARKSGLSVFTWKGKSYNTDLKAGGSKPASSSQAPRMSPSMRATGSGNPPPGGYRYEDAGRTPGGQTIRRTVLHQDTAEELRARHDANVARERALLAKRPKPPAPRVEVAPDAVARSFPREVETGGLFGRSRSYGGSDQRGASMTPPRNQAMDDYNRIVAEAALKDAKQKQLVQQMSQGEPADAAYAKGGKVGYSKMEKEHVAQMKKHGVPEKYVKEEEKEAMGMKRGGMACGGMKKYADGGAVKKPYKPSAGDMNEKSGGDQEMKMREDIAERNRNRGPGRGPLSRNGMKDKPFGYARGGGVESKGKTKGTFIKMASGGSVSARADGIAQRGKTNCKMR